MNQEQIKNKTYTWCKKMYENGLFNMNNYNECIASFNHDHQGEIPNNLKDARTGLENAYGLYNRKPKYIESANPENLDQKMYLTNFSGRYLACNKEGKFYLVTDFQNSKINQSDLEWSIISLEDNKISILSNYGKYLTATLDDCVRAELESINAASKWEIVRIDNDMYLKSVLFPEKMTYELKDKFVDLKLKSGMNENAIWNMRPVNISDDGSIVKKFDASNLNAEKRKQMNLYIKGKKISKIVNTEIFILRQLLFKIRNNINAIKKHIDANFETSLSSYRSLSSKYMKELSSLDDYRRNLSNTTLNDTQYLMLTNNISKLEDKLKLGDTININRNTKNRLHGELNRYMESCSIDIQQQIKKREEYLSRQNLDNIDLKLDSFIERIEKEISNYQNQNNQNNEIISKQSKLINVNNQEILVQEKEIKNYESKDNVLKTNNQIMRSSVGTLTTNKNIKITGCVLLGIMIIYLLYKIFINVRTAYFDD